jgi:hypothetical protein
MLTSWEQNASDMISHMLANDSSILGFRYIDGDGIPIVVLKEFESSQASC